jgi:hypothetical protein
MANVGCSSFNTNLARGTVGNDLAPTIWTYSTTDSVTGAAGVKSGGYFNAAANRLKVGDLIYVTNQATPFQATLLTVRSNTRSIIPTFVAGVVNVGAGTLLTSTISSYGTA